MKRLVFLGLVFLIAVSFASAVGEKTIRTIIEYQGDSEFDSDNNGISTIDSAIDFTVKNTEFSWTANESKLCTRWYVLPEDELYSTTICYGSVPCCTLVELYPSSRKWDDTFYLYRDLYQSGPRNSVGAQVLYADYTLDYDRSLDVAYSNFSYLPAVFTEVFRATAISIQESAEAVIASPSNASSLSSGEGVYLIAIVNASATAVYSLDSSSNSSMTANQSGTGTNLSDLLKGGLPFNVLSNGNHVAKVYIATESRNITIEHPFTVSDTTPPSITLTNRSNTSFVIKTSERSNVSYELNGIGYNASLNDSNAALLILNVTNGANTLKIYAKDMHGNENRVNHSLSILKESCTDGTQNSHDGQQETGVDCGGSCSACINLSASTDKNSYRVNELVYIQVLARSDTAHNIIVTGPNYYNSLTYNGSTYYIISPSTAGNYTVNVTLKYRNLPTETVLTSFKVNSTEETNPLSAEVNANATTISVNEIVSFSASASGNISALQYNWYLNEDSVSDSTSKQVNYTYTSPGIFTANLTIYDGTWKKNATKEITVLPYYNITIRTKDKTNGLDMQAILLLDGEEKLSPYDVILKNGRHRLEANYSGYINYSSYLDVTKNETVTIYLTTDTKPEVTLISPSDNEIITSNDTGFVFDVGRLPITCSIYIGTGSSLKEAARAAVNISPYTFYPKIANGSQNWKVTCTDEAGNTGGSGIRTFTLTALSKKDSKIMEDINEVLKAIDTVASGIDFLEKDEKEAANTMNYRKLLDNAKFELQRANRDLFNIPWRRFSEAEEEKFREEITKRVDTVKEGFITNISVTRTGEFVSYPQDATVEEVARDYIKTGTYTRDEITNYVSRNTELQTKTSVTTRYTNLKLTKYSGEVISGTLIERKLSQTNDSEIAVIEVVPKSVVISASEIDVFTKFTILKDDPVLEVEPIDDRYAFMIRKSLTPVDIQSAETVFIYKKVEPLPKKNSGITGFAIMNIEKVSNIKAIITEIIILMIIGGMYLGYSRTGFGESGSLKELKTIMRKATALGENDHSESARHYQKISELFRALKKKEKRLVYPPLIELGDKIRRDKTMSKIREAQILCSHNQIEAARKVYSEISSIYKSLPSRQRKELFTDCREIHKKLIK